MSKIKPRKTRPSEIETLQRRLEEAEETLRAIRRGDVDALVVAGPHGDQVFTLNDACRPYRHLAEQMQMGVCILNPQGSVLFANSYLAHMLGVELEQLMALPWSHWVRSDDQSRLGRLLQKALERGVKSEFELVSATGEPRPVQLSLSHLRTAEGQRLAALVFDLRPRKRAEEALRRAQNQLEGRVMERTRRLSAVNAELMTEIAERKRAEEKLRRSEAYLAEGQKLSHTASWAWNASTGELFGSEELYRIYGLDPAKVKLGYPGVVRCIHPEDRPQAQRILEDAVREQRVYELDYRVVRPDGTTRYIHNIAHPVFDDAGDLVEYVGTTIDATDHIRAEETLRTSEAEMAAIFERSASAIALTDLGGRFVKVNRAFQELLGYREAELMATTYQDVVHPDDRARNVALSAELLNGSRSEYQLEKRERRKDGTWIWVRVSASLIPDAEGNPRFLMKVVEDITEQVAAYQLLEHRVEERTREIERRRQVAEGLQEFLKSLNAMRPLDEVLQLVVAQACQMFNTDSCAIFEIEPGKKHLGVRASRGLPGPLSPGARFPITKGPVSRAILERVPAMISHWEPEVATSGSAIGTGSETEIGLSAQMRAVAAVPLQVNNETYGALVLYFHEPHAMTDEEFQLAILVAAQAALAIETARLYEQERRIATLEERQRLARELHDSVSQSLYGIQLEARSARERLERDPQRAAERLDTVLSLADEALVEMRAMIFELRPESLDTGGLVATLDKYAAYLSAQPGLQVQTIFGEEPVVSGQVKEALYRIAREALQNTVRHAQATRVELELHRGPRGLVMQISDNGIGFDTSRSMSGHLGLHTMAERAARLGGSIEIESTPSIGTFIRVEIPL